MENLFPLESQSLESKSRVCIFVWGNLLDHVLVCSCERDGFQEGIFLTLTLVTETDC